MPHAERRSALRPPQRRGEITAELRGEIHRDARMHSALSVEELGVIGEGYECSVPDIRVNIKTALTVAPESHKLIGRDVVSGQGERNHETLAVHWVDELAAVRVVVGAPNQRTLANGCGAGARRFLGPVAPTEKITVADRVIARKKSLALPPKLEYSLSDAALISGICIDWPPALCRPARDLDGEAFRVIHQGAVTGQAAFRGSHQRRLVHAPYADCRGVGYFGGVKFHKCAAVPQSGGRQRLAAE